MYIQHTNMHTHTHTHTHSHTHTLTHTHTQGELQEARQSLLDGLDRSPELDRLVLKLSFSQCLYLLSIHRLESLRSDITTGHMTSLFNPFQTGE